MQRKKKKRERKGSQPWSQKRRCQWQRGKWRQQIAEGFRYDPQTHWSSSWCRTDTVFGKPKAQQLSTASLSPSTPLTSLPSSSSKAGSLRPRHRIPLRRRRWAAASPFSDRWLRQLVLRRWRWRRLCRLLLSPAVNIRPHGCHVATLWYQPKLIHEWCFIFTRPWNFESNWSWKLYQNHNLKYDFFLKICEKNISF